MRTLVDIPENKLKKLAELCKSQGISRAEGIRQAVEMFLKKNSTSDIGQFFGILKGKGLTIDGVEYTDGVEYQRKLREEWD